MSSSTSPSSCSMNMGGSVPNESDDDQGHQSGVSTKFCLKWNNFGRNVTTSFKTLLENEEFVDISLSAEGSTLKAHKVVLSASSSYFRDILQSISSWQHPVILLRDVPFSDLQGIVEFIYHGEVSIEQENLQSFLKTAQVLKVKGLTEETTATADSSLSHASTASTTIQSHNNLSGHHYPVVKEEEEPEIQGPMPRLAHPSSFPNSGNHMVHHPRKNAYPKRANKSDVSTHVGRLHASLSPLLAAAKVERKLISSSQNSADREMKDVRVEVEEEEGEEDEEEEEEITGPQARSGGVFAGEIDDREEDEIAAVQTAAALEAVKQNFTSNVFHFLNASKSAMKDLDGDHESAFDGSASNPMGLMETDVQNLAFGSPKILRSLESNSPMGPGSGALSTQKKTCPYCFQQLSWHALSRHIRDMHKAKTGSVTCEFCQKTFRNTNSLGCHKWRFHNKDSRKSRSGSGPEPSSTVSNVDGMTSLEGFSNPTPSPSQQEEGQNT
ncbi:uncharacterized protein LOC131881884 [Tigriopus californicus]|nr:uncharacterized protein LOC131881884 [Tigriopus californicus]